MQYTYEFEMWRGEKEWCIASFDLPGATQGTDVKDVCESAADFLRETIQEYLIHGDTPPVATFDNKPRHNGVRVIISVDASLDNVEKVSAAQAAEILGVSRGRITAMVNKGLLDGWRDGRNSWITQESIKARSVDTPKAGRPKKAATA